jgi:predicted DNA-binding transcriptional regulator YafY
MGQKTVTEDRAEALLEQLRSRRRLPPASERRRIREAAGVSLRQLGAAIPPHGVSAMAVLRWEAGATPRDTEHLRAYGRLLEELRHLGGEYA